MIEIVTFIVKSLATNEDAVKVTESIDGDLTILHVICDEADMGRVIGKGGKVAGSIRAIVKSIAAREKKRFAVRFGE